PHPAQHSATKANPGYCALVHITMARGPAPLPHGPPTPLADGPVLDAPGLTWRGINGALRKGYRGLPGGPSWMPSRRHTGCYKRCAAAEVAGLEDARVTLARALQRIREGKGV